VRQSREAGQRERRRRLLELLADVPDPLRSYDQYVKYHHLDLAQLSLSRVLFERDRLKQLLLLFEDAADPWHAARLRAIEAHLRRAR
jgi:hypothetical protein